MLDVNLAQTLHDVFLYDPAILHEAGFTPSQIASIEVVYPAIMEGLMQLESTATLHMMYQSSQERLQASQRDTAALQRELSRRIQGFNSEDTLSKKEADEQAAKEGVTRLRAHMLQKARMAYSQLQG